MWRSSSAALAMSLAAAAVHADESTIRLAQAEGVERVQAACAMCHSLDYIVMNSPFQDRAGWEKTVTKMVKVMGAPIAPEDAVAIVDYLEKQYGRAAAAAATR
jgi:cytochrome c5